MRSVKIRIPGSFWDSQLYSNEIILFTDSGTIVRADWRAAIDSVAEQYKNVRTALRVAFMDGDLFYNDKVRKILLDPALAKPIRQQLDQLADGVWEVDLIRDSGVSKNDSPFDFVPTDTDIYYNTIIASGDEGLFTCSRMHLGKKKPKSYAAKHHDARFLQVRASDRNTAIAAAAGTDGLMEFGFEKRREEAELGQEKHLAKRPCSACEWAFQSVIGWSDEAAFIASFKEERRAGGSEKIRIPDRVIDFSEFFGADSGLDKSFAWGAREKFYKIDGDEVTVVERRDESRGRKDLHESSGEFKVIDKTRKSGFDGADVIATGTAPFGSVVEYSDRLVVIRSDGDLDIFSGELIHWRIFPRSSHFSNQLHLIYDHHMEIVSFVHDYFVDQSDKRFGFAKQTDGGKSEELFAEFM